VFVVECNNNNNNNNNNIHKEMDSKCRLCQKRDDTPDHTISACPVQAKEQYVK
jgi:hypothetical protein